MAFPLMPISFVENTPSFNVTNSLRLDGSTNYLLKRTQYEGNTKTFTQSVWVKRTLGRAQWLGPVTYTTNFKGGLYFGADDKLNAFIHYNFRTTRWEGLLTTQQVFRDPNAWYHIVLAVDTTQALPTNRIILYVNGVRVVGFDFTNTSNPTYPAQNQDTVFNTINSLAVSAINNTQASPGYTYIGYDPSTYYGGNISEMYWVDGQALLPTSFGRYDQNGIWVPRFYSGSYGPNGFYLPFNNFTSKSYVGINMGDPAGADPFRSYTTFHLQTRTNATAVNNNTFLDSSSNNATITRSGTVFQGTFNPFENTYPSLCSCSAYFNGRDGELNAGSNANFSFGTQDYTVEFWVYSTTETYTAGTGPSFVCNDASGGFIIWNQIGSAERGIKVQTRITGTTILATNTLLPINRWNHIAVCREGTTIALWLNGQRIGLGSDTTNWTVNGPLKLGSISLAGYYLAGWMSDVNVVKGVSKYSTSSTTIPVPTQPIESTGSTSLLCNFRNVAVYDSTNLNNIDTQGTSRVSTAQPLFGASNLLIDTATSGLSTTLVNSTPYFTFNSDDFTVESWVNVQAAVGYIASVHDAINVNSWILAIDSSLRLGLYGGNGQLFVSSNSVARFLWGHVAAVRSNDTVTLYINGQSGGTFRVTAGGYNMGTVGFHVGRPVAGIGQFNGYISDLRVTRAARYLENFTPPQSPLPTTGRRNNWWPNNINTNNSRVNNSFIDSPTNINTNNTINATLTSNINGGFCTLSPIMKGTNFSLTNGNLDGAVAIVDASWRNATGTVCLSSGKWYWEVECTGAPSHIMFGIARSDWINATAENTYPGLNGETWAYYGFAGNMYRNGSATSFGGTAVNTGDVVGCALDLDNGNFYVSKNGAWQGTILPNPSIGRTPLNSTRLAPGAWAPSIGVYQSGTVSCNFGQRPFLYADSPALSAGFKPICTSNLPIPSIRRPSNFFSATSYTGGTNTFNTDSNAGSLVLAMPLDSYNTYFDVSNEISSRISQPKALYTTTGVTYTSISGAAFNGTTGYIELSAHPDFDLGITGNWTIEWYQYWNVLTGFQTVWHNNYTTIPNLLIQSQNGLGRYQLYTNGGTSILNEGNAPTPGLWYHYAVVKNGTTYTIFRNGSATGVTTYTAVTNAGSTTSRPEIGRGSGTYFVNGNIRDFRIYKGWAKYTTTFNPATATTAVVATTGTGFDKSFNIGFQPDLVWIKARNIGRTSHILVDSVRGGTSTLSANSVIVATISSNNVTFNQTGFTVGGSVSANIITIIPAVSALFYGTGYNLEGQLGLGTNSNRNAFTPLTGNWSQMACGAYHTMALSAGTTKWFGTGRNTRGQLGLGNNSNRNAFTALTGDWSQMVCGAVTTMALSAGTTKWFGTGRNTEGQLGLGDNSNRNVFTPLTGNWSQMVCGGIEGDDFTMALSAGTTKWFGTGYNGFDQLGLGDNSDRNAFTPLTGNWSQMACGTYHTMALSAGTTKWYGTGYNGSGQLGLGDNADRIVLTALTGNWSQMTCGGDYTMALSAGTTEWFGTGYNVSGQLGLGDNSNRNAFTPLTGNWSQMACGLTHTMALSAGTTKWFGTGYNVSGQLGLGDNSNRNVFTPLTGNWSQMVCGGDHTMALSISSAEFSTFNIAQNPFNPLLNTPGATYTAYGWKRNALAGFDIVNFNKVGTTNETFNHELGRIPQMIIVKGVTFPSGWNVYHAFASPSTPAGAYLALETNQAATVAATMWNSTQPTAAQFSLGTAWSGGNYIAYLFAEIPGFSQFGTYTGTGVADGPFIWTGFKPKFVMTKRTDAVSDWLIWDSSRGPINPISPHFTVNSAQQDNSIVSPTYTGYIDFVSTGFKMRLASEPNTSTARYIYAAFAEEPFGRTPSQTTAK